MSFTDFTFGFPSKIQTLGRILETYQYQCETKNIKLHIQWNAAPFEINGLMILQRQTPSLPVRNTQSTVHLCYRIPFALVQTSVTR